MFFMKAGDVKRGVTSLKAAWDSMSGTYDRITARSKRWAALCKAGGGDVTACLEADFGQGGPANLDLKPFLNQRIEIKSFFKDPWFQQLSPWKKVWELLTIAGRGGNNISLSPLAAGREKTSTSAHEFVHTRQRHIWQAGWYGVTEGNNIGHVGQHEKRTLSREWRRLSRKTLNLINFTPGIGGVGTYYAQNCEMQARMQEILATGYQQWQKMPLNKTELWAALINFGMPAPRFVTEHMKTPEGQKALTDFRVMESLRNAMSGVVYTFKTVQLWAGDDDLKQALWNAQYPLLYGELLEMYGDIPGRARMRLGSNPRPSIEVTNILMSFPGRMTTDIINDLSDRIPNDQAVPFINNLIHLSAYRRYIRINGLLITRNLLNRPGVKGAFLEPEQLTVHDYTGQDERPPLVSALEWGDREMVHLLMKAGANPFQAYQMVDMRGENAGEPQYPADIIKYIQTEQKYLGQPEKLPAKTRKLYTDPSERQDIMDDIARKKYALEAMEDYILKTGKRYPVRKNGKSEQLYFKQALATLGIGHNSTNDPPYQPEGADLSL